ncbi:MAG: glycosyltransferase family 39 protein [Candidatus Saganbacteria bacterium]|nr:glycosyltransferase family 39 protein [Candidatus Saganbacteria bacterium]
MISAFKKTRPEIWLLAILLFALFLRVWFFVGLVSADPQDDGIYYNNAFIIFKEGGLNLSKYKDLPADYQANPAETFSFRSLVIYPVAGFFKLFGPSEVSAALFSLFTSLAMVVLIFYMGKLLFNVKVGLLASFLLSFYPLNVIYATRILGDIPLAFFVGLCVLLFLLAGKKKKPLFYLFSGVALGVAYLVKITALIVIPVLLIKVVLDCIRTKKIDFYASFFVCGFLLVFLFEAAFFYSQSGDPFLNYHINSSALINKYVVEPVGIWAPFSKIKIYYNTGTPIYHIKHLFFLASHRSNVNLVGLFGIFGAIAVIYSLLKRKNIFIVLWLLFLFFYFEFGCVSVKWQNGALAYLMIFKDPRFLTMLTIPLLLLVSFLLMELKRFKFVLLVLIGLLFFSSLYYVNEDHKFYRGSLAPLRQVAEFVREHPADTFFGDYLAVNNLRILTRHKLGNINYWDEQTDPNKMHNAYVVFGGARGHDVGEAKVFDLLPIKKPPYDWHLAKQVADIEIYYVK